MPSRFVQIDRETPLLLAPNLRDWVPANHLSHFIIDVVEELNLQQVRVNERGTGSEQYPPRMLLSLLIYSYATGTFGSRRIEQSSFDSVAVRMICGDTHPDHDTLCAFRRENKALLSEIFVKVLELAKELKFVRVGEITVAVDGSKVLANASKHAAVSYERAGEMMEQLDLEVAQLLEKAEKADSAPLADGLSVPEEIARRQERKARLAKARAEIEVRARSRAAAELEEHKAKLAARQEREQKGEKPRGKAPEAPSPEPGPKDQYNFTDPESRIMKAGNGQHFEQAYNAQAAVAVESRLIVGQRVSQACNDKEQLVPSVEAIVAVAGPVETVLADSGFYSQEAVAVIEGRKGAEGSTGITVFTAMEKTGHHRSVADLEKRDDPPAPEAGASPGEVMRHRLKTAAGKAKYKLRQQTVEPVFGIIKSVLGFRQFLLRGLQKVSLEWELVSLAYNCKRLHRLGAGLKLGQAG